MARVQDRWTIEGGGRPDMHARREYPFGAIINEMIRSGADWLVLVTKLRRGFRPLEAVAPKKAGICPEET
ncbi:hypothetical protein BESB_072440 [Besnoitia besnoiti]|uniref:Uncharacterized protein n=1 Tax=Besnoitia besnoiti TaxID=94643 RepID=A0A2A9MFC8_BESBE|nr:uncharacterized protein BESB_072440 [Besnoitia besnoiti]PFH34092.1 hypothetical protein BESB_072440 [Besnoitia besnoiti]